MGLLTTLLTLPVTGPFKGLIAIARHIQSQAEEAAEPSASSIQTRLMELEALLLLEEISSEEYARQEEELLKELNDKLAYEEEKQSSS